MKVSICIPAYKELDYLKKCILSVNAQTYTDFEVIISDDTPDDSVKELLNSLQLDDRYLYFKNKPSLGSPANWNAAIRKAKGDYIKMMHHDDWFVTVDGLQKFMEMMSKSSKNSFVFCSSKVVYANRHKTRVNKLTETELNDFYSHPARLFLENKIGAPSATLFRNDGALYDENLIWLVDVEYYLRRLFKNERMIYINEPLIETITDSAHTVTSKVINNASIQVFEHFYVYKKYFAEFLNDKKYADRCRGLLLKILKKFNLSNKEQLIDLNLKDSELEEFILSFFSIKKTSRSGWFSNFKWKF